MRKILVPIDFSACATNALHFAIQLGKVIQAELLLFHAHHPPVGKSATFYVNEQTMHQEEQKAKIKLRKLTVSNPHFNHSICCFMVKMALATDGIVEAAHTHGVSCIVMGTKGIHDKADEIMCSNTYAVIKRADCHVIAVPANYQEFRLKNIAFATDFQGVHHEQSLFFLISLTRTFQASLQILHVHPDPNAIRTKEEEEIVVLEYILQDMPHAYHFLHASDVEQEIESYLQNHATDLLVMMPKQHHWFDRLFNKSVTKAFALHSQIPLLTLPYQH